MQYRPTFSHLVSLRSRWAVLLLIVVDKPTYLAWLNILTSYVSINLAMVITYSGRLVIISLIHFLALFFVALRR